MAEVTKYEQGIPSWLDLSTSDLAAAESFYRELFGWDHQRMDAGDGQFYSMQYLKGKTVAGMMEQSKEQIEQGMPPSWSTYITVNRVDEVAARAEKLGGRVISEPMDIFDSGRMAVLQDPEGAFFFLWQPNKHIGAGLVNEPGTVTWNELVADDPQKLGSFYRALLDIEIKDMEGMPDYRLFHVGERSVAGIFKKTEEMKSLPSLWSVYFSVDDCDRIAEKVRSLGGKVIKGPTDTPMGPFAVLQDPQGAVFQVIANSGGA